LKAVELRLPVEEVELWKLYFQIHNLTEPKGDRLSNGEIELASFLASKPLDYSLNTNSIERVRKDICSSLNMKKAYLWQCTSSLKKRGIIHLDESKFYLFHPMIENTRKKVKESIKTKEPFHYIMTFIWQ